MVRVGKCWLLFISILASTIGVIGCGDGGGGTVQPPKVEPTATDAPVDEPPSTDEK